MEIKDAYGRLEEIEGGEEIKTFFKDYISKLNNEAASRRKELDTITPEFEKMKSEFKQAVELIQKSQGTEPTPSDPSDPTSLKLSKQLEELTSKMTKMEEEKEQASRQITESKKREALRKELERLNVLPDTREDLTSILSSRYVQDDQGDWVKEDGTVLSKDVEAYLDGKDFLIQNSVRPGMGSKPPAERATPRSFAEAKTPEEKFKIVQAKLNGGG